MHSDHAEFDSDTLATGNGQHTQAPPAMAPPSFSRPGGGTALADSRHGGESGGTIRYRDGEDRIRPLLSQIRSRMLEINEREFLLRRREVELAQTQRAAQVTVRQATDGELAAQKRSLDDRARALDAQAADLTRRLAALADQEQTLDRRETELDIGNRELERIRGELRAARADLEQQAEQHRARRAEDRAALQRRAGQVRESDEARQRRTAEIERALAAEREAVAQERAAIEERLRALEAEQEALGVRRTQIEEQERHIQDCLAAIEQDQFDLANQRSEVDAARVAAEELKRVAERERAAAAARQESCDQQVVALEGQRVELEQRLALEQREIERRAALARDQLAAELTDARRAFERNLAAERAELDQQLGQLAAERDALERREAAATAQAAKLASESESLHARLTSIEKQDAELRQRERDVRVRTEQLEAEQTRLTSLDQDLNRQRDELYEVRQAVESREAAARQAAAALEIERHQTEALRSRLEQSLSQADQQRSMLEIEFAETQAALTREARRLERASSSVATAPRMWPLRSLALASAAAVATAILWGRVDRSQQATTAEIEICSDRPNFNEALGEHLATLSDETRVAALLPAPQDFARWQRWRNSGALTIAAAADHEALQLTVRDADTKAAEELLRKLSQTYAAAQSRVGGLGELPGVFGLLADQLLIAEDEQRTLREQCVRLEAELGQVSADDSAAAQAEVTSARQEQMRLGERLNAARNRLTGLAAAGAPRGQVSPAAIEAELKIDEMYQADSSELAAVFGDYRAEVLVALALPEPATRTFITNLKAFRRVVDEQLALKPPQAVARGLEDCNAAIDQFLVGAEPALNGWEELRGKATRMNEPKDSLAFVEQFDEGANIVRRIRRDADETLRRIQTRLDELSALGGGSTREVVTMSVVRGEFNSLMGAAAPLSEAGSKLDVATNFQLDALDRQMRSLHKRLEDRPLAIRERLQIAADQTAQEEHARAIGEAREQVQTLEAQREESAAKVLALLDRCRLAQEAELRRARIESELQQHRAAAERRSHEAARIGQDVARARQLSTTTPDTLALTSLRSFSIGGEAVEQRRWIAAICAFFGTLIVAVAMVLRLPGQRRDARLIGEFARREEASGAAAM
ncbi:MAG: hypothetical protein SF069_12585 [Phycisphaerae bacterium]|nr:hypothetical protein [Phycisphaerae bacterium]